MLGAAIAPLYHRSIQRSIGNRRLLLQYLRSMLGQYSGQFTGMGLEKSYPPLRVQVKHGAQMDSLTKILTGLLSSAGHLVNPSASFC